jgi:hypothetical protein
MNSLRAPDSIGIYSGSAPSETLIRLADLIDRYLYRYGYELSPIQRDKLRFLAEGIRGNGRTLATVNTVGLFTHLDRELKRLQQSIEAVRDFLEDSRHAGELISRLSLVFHLATTIARVMLPLLG